MGIVAGIFSPRTGHWCCYFGIKAVFRPLFYMLRSTPVVANLLPRCDKGPRQSDRDKEQMSVPGRLKPKSGDGRSSRHAVRGKTKNGNLRFTIKKWKSQIYHPGFQDGRHHFGILSWICHFEFYHLFTACLFWYQSYQVREGVVFCVSSSCVMFFL